MSLRKSFRIGILCVLVSTFAFGADIGFKGMFLGEDTVKGCAILKSFEKSFPELKYSEVSEKCGFVKTTEFGTSFYSYIEFKNNKIYSMEFDDNFQNKIFNLSGLNLKEKAQTLVDNVKWISNLKYEEESYKGNTGAYFKIQKYRARDLEQGFELLISYHPMGYTKLALKKLDVKKASF